MPNSTGWEGFTVSDCLAVGCYHHDSPIGPSCFYPNTNIEQSMCGLLSGRVRCGRRCRSTTWPLLIMPRRKWIHASRALRGFRMLLVAYGPRIERALVLRSTSDSSTQRIFWKEEEEIFRGMKQSQTSAEFCRSCCTYP